ncbi:MAG: hypothetical protein ACLFRV_04280 [Acidimicrobiales bacterium]
MTEHQWIDEPAPQRTGVFMRVAAQIGDLSSPFYDEERQRDVWNEASAVGLQVAIWLGFLAASALVWVGGADQVPLAIGICVLVAVPAAVAETYARKLGVRADSVEANRTRLLVLALLATVFSLGMARAWLSDFPPSGGFVPGFKSGMAIGASGGSLAVLALTVKGYLDQRRRDPSARPSG